MTSARDWFEDFNQENGNYQNECSLCTRNFLGHKDRRVCKKCAGEQDLSNEETIELEQPIIVDLSNLPPLLRAAADAIEGMTEAMGGLTVAMGALEDASKTSDEG